MYLATRNSMNRENKDSMAVGLVLRSVLGRVAKVDSVRKNRRVRLVLFVVLFQITQELFQFIKSRRFEIPVVFLGTQSH
jgi:hypothetical protein